MAKGKTAKGKKKPPSGDTGALAANRRRRKKRTVTTTTRSTRTMVSNPPIGQDIVNVLLPGFGAYAATRVLSRIVYSLVQSRWPTLGKHASAIAGAAAFGGVWFFAHKIDKLAKYHDGIVMGSGVAALHGIATCYLPDKYSWLLTDCRPEDVTPIAPSTSQVPPGLSAPTSSATPAAGDDEYSYLERHLEDMESGRSKRTRTVAAPKPSARPVAQALSMANQGGGDVAMDPDLMSELTADEDVDDLYSGAFSNNN